MIFNFIVASTSCPVAATGAAAPMIPSGANQISPVIAEINAPADIASLFTKVTVSPGNFASASMMSKVTSSAPPGVFMSSTTTSAFCSIASFSPRRKIYSTGEAISSRTGMTTTRFGAGAGTAAASASAPRARASVATRKIIKRSAMAP